MSCSEKVQSHYDYIITQLKTLYDEYREGANDNLLLYHYAFDFDEDLGCFRYHLSGGGPSEEIRFYAVQTRKGWKLLSAEFWLLDWFDGAKIDITSEDFKFMEELFWMFDEFQITESAWLQCIEQGAIEVELYPHTETLH